MNAYRFYPPGGPEKINPSVEPIPKPSGTQVLIRVHAVSIIGAELTWRVYQNPDGSWRTHIPGHDFSGVVEELGPDCPAGDAGDADDANIRRGSEVVAFTLMKGYEGGLAEYAIADLDSIAPKPKNLSFEEAASFPLSALTAWQALHDHAKIQPGENILITGAAGGTGIFLVAMARLAGAGRIIATASSDRSFEMLKDLGVDEIVNYKSSPDLSAAISQGNTRIDVIIDCVGHSTFTQSVDVLVKQKQLQTDNPHSSTPGGTEEGEPRLVSIVEYDAKQLAQKKGITSAVFFIVEVNNEHLRQVAKLMEQRRLMTVIEQVFSFEEARKAYEVAWAGHVHGKMVVRVQ